MRRHSLAALAGGLLLTVSPASAAIHPGADTPFPRGEQRTTSRDIFGVRHAEKIKWKAGGCKYEYKADKKGFKEKYKCK